MLCLCLETKDLCLGKGEVCCKLSGCSKHKKTRSGLSSFLILKASYSKFSSSTISSACAVIYHVMIHSNSSSFQRCLIPGVIEIRDKQPTVAMYCHGIPPIFFGGKYDLIQLHRQIIHQNDGISMRNWLKSSPPVLFIYKENNENDMTFC